MIEQKIDMLISAVEANTVALITLAQMQTPTELGVTDTVGGMETTAERGEPDVNPTAVGGITELDVNNNPWDERIHTVKRTKTVKGVWKLMKKPATYPDKAQWDAYVASVLLQFKATVIPAQAEVPPAQVPPAQVPPAQVPPAQVPPATTIPTPPATTLPTIDDVRTKMMEYSQTKGASAVIETIATFAPTLEQVDPSQYGNLIGAMMLRPDLVPPTHPARQ